MYNITGIEVWLSLVEYYVRDVGAAGSNPVTSTSLKSSVFPILRGVQSFFLLCFSRATAVKNSKKQSSMGVNMGVKPTA